MDIQHLVDRLEDLIDEGRHMPFSKFTMIDEERALELIDQMRISIPEEIEKANRVLMQRDRVLAQANEEAARILQQARQKAEQLVDQEVSVQAAANRAANIIEQARQEAESITNGADEYAMSVLMSLEQQLMKTVNVVRNGINEVHQSKMAAPTTNEAPQIIGQPVQMPQPAPREMVDAEMSAPNPRPENKK